MDSNLENSELWFDVEKRYNTTPNNIVKSATQLWFDVEKRYNTTTRHTIFRHIGCGLM